MDEYEYLKSKQDFSNDIKAIIVWSLILLIVSFSYFGTKIQSRIPKTVHFINATYTGEKFTKYAYPFFRIKGSEIKSYTDLCKPIKEYKFYQLQNSRQLVEICDPSYKSRFNDKQKEANDPHDESIESEDESNDRFKDKPEVKNRKTKIY